MILKPPFGVIADALASGNVIPFLGSAASLPDERRSDWKEHSDNSYPSARQLAQYLADKAQYPCEDVGRDKSASAVAGLGAGAGPTDAGLPEDPWIPELRKAAQYMALVNGRGYLIDYLDEVFSAKPPLGQLHQYLAGLESPDGEPLIVVTTNYDDLVERAFDEIGRDYLLVLHTTGRDRGDKLLVREPGGDFREEDANTLADDRRTGAVIYKMHGSIRRTNERGEYVITDDDYVDFLARMTRSQAVPAIINRPLKFRSFLFLGYGLEDWNLRVLLSQLAERGGHASSDSAPGLRSAETSTNDDAGEAAAEPRHRHRSRKNWAIQKGPSLFDEKYWSEKGVEVFDMTIQDFVKALPERSP